jgi:hypothetical protein
MSSSPIVTHHTVPRPTLGVYEWTSIVGAIVYFSLPLFALNPEWFTRLSGTTLSAQGLIDLQVLFGLVTPIGLIYLYGVASRALSLLDMTLAWRLAWVAPWLVLSVARGSISPRVALLFGSADVGLPLLAIALDPRARGALGRLRAHFATPFERFGQRLLFVLALLGLVGVTLTSAYTLWLPDAGWAESFGISVTGCYFLGLLWAARAEWPRVRWFILGVHVLLGSALANAVAAGVTREWAIDLLVFTVVTTYVSIYSILWHAPRVRGIGRASFSRWLILGGVATAGLSALWALGMPSYGPTCSVLAVNIHRQDLIIAGFAVLVGVLVAEVSQRAHWHSAVIAWLLPFSAVWFTTATKALCHFGVGSPFHPSWTARGLAPVWGGSNAMDVEFWFATMLMTAVSTTFTAIVLLLHMNTRGWRRLGWHGIAVILVSAIWMVMTTSGMPTPLRAMADAGAVPRFLPGDPIAAVAVHVRDLLLGMVLIAAGPLLDRWSPETSRAVTGAVIIAWLLSLVPKLFVHLQLVSA